MSARAKLWRTFFDDVRNSRPELAMLSTHPKNLVDE
jgi:hypothetical protein